MDMWSRIISSPPILAYFIILALSLGFGLGLFFLTHRFTDMRMRRSHNDIAGYIFTTMGAIYGVLLAFITVVVWQNYNDAASNAGKEAGAALAVYRNLKLYPDQEQAGEMVPALSAYVKAVVLDEYPAMAEGKRSQGAAAAIDLLWAEFKELKPRTLQEQVLFQEILRNLNTMAQLRLERLVSAFNPKLSGLMRSTILLGALITILGAIFFGAENFWWHISLTSLLILLIATILFTLLELGNPFSGGVVIKADDYLEVLRIMEGR